MTFDSFHAESHFYFLTASVCGWKRLFLEPRYAEIVLASLDWLRCQARMNLFAFVLMPSHLHAIIRPTGCTIGDLLQDLGSYTAHRILGELKADHRSELLEFFQQERRDRRHRHSVWQDIQAKNIYSADFLQQKLEYIHNNPVGKDWGLVADRADYVYSSACFYDRGLAPPIAVDDIREVV